MRPQLPAVTNPRTRAAASCREDGYGVFFVVFIVVGGFVMLNLYIAVIMENFSNEGNGACAPSRWRWRSLCASLGPGPLTITRARGADVSELTVHQIQAWVRTWSFFDPSATKTMPVVRRGLHV